MVSIKEVESLNKRIEKINQDYTKKKTQQDMLYERLTKEIKAYQEEFGVNLSGKNLAEIKSKISAEHKKVVSTVEEAYAEKLKIVSAIEEGDYEEAAALLGIVAETVDSEESEEETTETENETQQDEVDAMSISFNETEEETEAESEDDLFGFGGIDEEDSSDEEVSATEVDDTEEDEEDNEVSIPGIDEDDDVEDVGIGGFLDALKGSTVEEAIQDVENPKESDQESNDEVSFGGFTVDDSNDEDEEDFGFGDLLSGTKFGEE